MARHLASSLTQLVRGAASQCSLASTSLAARGLASVTEAVAEPVRAQALGGLRVWQAASARLGAQSSFSPMPWCSERFHQPCPHAVSPWQQSQHRTIFGQAQPRENLQIHTHDKYKKTTPQPEYKWMLGRFVMDRNGQVWHKQANQRHGRKGTSSVASRLGRWKALAPAYAAKFRKLPGVPQMLKYWQDPDPKSVPGFEDKDKGYRDPPRRNAEPDKHPVTGDVALRPHGPGIAWWRDKVRRERLMKLGWRGR